MFPGFGCELNVFQTLGESGVGMDKSLPLETNFSFVCSFCWLQNFSTSVFLPLFIHSARHSFHLVLVPLGVYIPQIRKIKCSLQSKNWLSFKLAHISWQINIQEHFSEFYLDYLPRIPIYCSYFPHCWLNFQKEKLRMQTRFERTNQ